MAAKPTMLTAEGLKNLEEELAELQNVKRKEIAEKMFISSRTVENYRDALYEKFDIKSRVGLVLFAIKEHYCKP